ncbi:hypothetical protein, partial [Pseudonocardia zijingensis]|uniref:hypothetical protein n=1 Tax=Pseudonocardia zijingensis TaxID=153376 RepID=UPI0031E32837
MVAGGGLVLAAAGAVLLRATRGRHEGRAATGAPTRRAERRGLQELRAATKEVDSSLAGTAAQRLSDAIAASAAAEAAVYALLVGGIRAVVTAAVTAAPESVRTSVAVLARKLGMDERDVAAIARDRKLPATTPDLGPGGPGAQGEELVRLLDEAMAALRATADEVAAASKELAEARRDALTAAVRQAADALTVATIARETGLSVERVAQILGSGHADVPERTNWITRLARVVAARLAARRGRQAGAGTARGPPATAGEVLEALEGRRTVIGEIPANRWPVEQLPVRWVLEQNLRGIAAAMESAGGAAGQAAAAGATLAALDRHIDTARKAGWNARWRGGTSILHRWLYVPVTFLVIGLLLTPMYVMTVFAGAPVVAAAVGAAWWAASLSLFAIAALGQMAGNALLGGLWFRLSPRAMTTASLLGAVAVAAVITAFPGSASAYAVGAVLAGIVTSGNFFALDTFQGWVGRTTTLRRDSGRLVIFWDGVVGVAVLGMVTVLSVLLVTAEGLVLTAAATVLAAVALVAAGLAWLVTPAARWDRPSAPTFREQLVAPVQVVLRNRFALNVTAIYAAYPFTMGSIDAEWRPFFEAAHAAKGEVFTARFAFVGGGLVVAALFALTDIVNAVKSRKDVNATTGGSGLLNRYPAPAALVVAGVMVVGGIVGWIGAHLGVFGAVPSAIFALWAMEASTTGLLVALNAVITTSTRLTDQEKTAVKLAGAQAKAVFYFLGATLAVSVERAFHWGGNISVVVAGTVVTFVLTAFLLDLSPLWRQARDRVRALLTGRSGTDDTDQGGTASDGGPGDHGIDPAPSATGGGSGPGAGGSGAAADVPSTENGAAAHGPQDGSPSAARGSVRKSHDAQQRGPPSGTQRHGVRMWVRVWAPVVLMAAASVVALRVALTVAQPVALPFSVLAGTAAVASSAAFAMRGGLNLVPHRPGVVGVVRAALLMGTFVVNVAWMGFSAFTATGLDAWIFGLYTATVALFGLHAANTAYNDLRGRPGPVHPVVDALVTWVAYPITSNLGNALYLYELGWVAFDPVLLSVTAALAVAFGVVSVLGIVNALRPGRLGAPYLQVMQAAGNVSLLYWGLLALWPGQWAPLVGAGAAALFGMAVVRGQSRFAQWRARLIHSPPAVLRSVLATVVPLVPAAVLGAVVVGAPLSPPVTITAVSGLATAAVLWVLHRMAGGAGVVLRARDERGPSIRFQ